MKDLQRALLRGSFFLALLSSLCTLSLKVSFSLSLHTHSLSSSSFSGEHVDLSKYDIHEVAGVLKSLLRKIEEPLIPVTLYEPLLTTARTRRGPTPFHFVHLITSFFFSFDEGNEDKKARLSILKAVFSPLPEKNKQVLNALIKLLALLKVQNKTKQNKTKQNKTKHRNKQQTPSFKTTLGHPFLVCFSCSYQPNLIVKDNSKENRMTSENLAVVLGPCILRREGHSYLLTRKFQSFRCWFQLNELNELIFFTLNSLFVHYR
jgi:hypothetical protein